MEHVHKGSQQPVIREFKAVRPAEIQLEEKALTKLTLSNDDGLNTPEPCDKLVNTTTFSFSINFLVLLTVVIIQLI